MSNPMQRGMEEATRLTREGQLAEATALIQRTLGGTTLGDHLSSAASPNASGDTRGPAEAISDTVDEAPNSTASPSGVPWPRTPWQPGSPGTGLRRSSKTTRRASGPRRFPPRLPTGMPGTTAPGTVGGSPASEPQGGRFISRSYTGRAGSRAYKLYIPSSYVGQAVPLLVMLHGCTQDPDDFAAGTRMNRLAEEQTFLVAYPTQAQNANMSKCWNWFQDAHQRRGEGEPSIIAGITREVCEEYSVASDRVYVAGMSAGGAMAAIMGTTYPDLYAAVGVHSGLAPGAARDLAGAFSAMQRGQGPGAAPRRDVSTVRSARTVPLIVFHGDRDTTVHPTNADHLLAHYGAAGNGAATSKTTPSAAVRKGQAPGGYAYTRQARHDADGRTVMERWTVHGLGHAWSGGASGSYTDPKGPDATAEMVRFFDQYQ